MLGRAFLKRPAWIKANPVSDARFCHVESKMMVWGPMNVLSISRQLRESAQQVAPTVRKRGCEESSVVAPARSMDYGLNACRSPALRSILFTSSRCSSSPTIISLANSSSKIDLPSAAFSNS